VSASVRLTLSLVVFQFVHHRKGVSLSPNTHANTQPRRTVVRKVDAEDEKGGCGGRERWMPRTRKVDAEDEWRGTPRQSSSLPALACAASCAWQDNTSKWPHEQVATPHHPHTPSTTWTPRHTATPTPPARSATEGGEALGEQRGPRGGKATART